MIQNILVIVMSVYIGSKCVYQSLNTQYSVDESVGVMIISLIIFKLISKHNLGFLIYRYL